jgi:hypothetical protein
VLCSTHHWQARSAPVAERQGALPPEDTSEDDAERPMKYIIPPIVVPALIALAIAAWVLLRP